MEPADRRRLVVLLHVLLFADGTDRHHRAVVTNLDWDGGRLLDWHRLKAGTVEHVHDELKNGLAAGHMPSQRFAVNAAWLKLALMSYNIASAIKGLRLCATPQTIARIRAVWEVFQLPTQATSSPHAQSAPTAALSPITAAPTRISRFSLRLLWRKTHRRVLRLDVRSRCVALTWAPA